MSIPQKEHFDHGNVEVFFEWDAPGLTEEGNAIMYGPIHTLKVINRDKREAFIRYEFWDDKPVQFTVAAGKTHVVSFAQKNRSLLRGIAVGV